MSGQDGVGAGRLAVRATTLHATWNRSTALFEVGASRGEPLHSSFQLESQREETVNGEVVASLHKLDDTAAEIFSACRGGEVVEGLLRRAIATRNDLLDTILGLGMPQHWLRRFAVGWQARLLVMLNAHASLDSRLVGLAIWTCHELLVVAGAWKLLGDVVQARSACGKCLALARSFQRVCAGRHTDTDDSQSEVARVEAMIHSSKQRLLAYVALDVRLTQAFERFERHDAPHTLQLQLTEQFALLRRQAPLSIPITTALATLLAAQRLDSLTLQLLTASPLTSADAKLTLLYARGLEVEGFWRQSIAVATRFVATRPPYGSVVGSTSTREARHNQLLKELRAHVESLSALQALKDQAEELARAGEAADATAKFTQCLAATSNVKVTAALLFGRANAFVELGNLTAATRDLKESIQLDPSNHLAKLVLKTVVMEQETSKMHAYLSKYSTDRGVHSASPSTIQLNDKVAS